MTAIEDELFRRWPLADTHFGADAGRRAIFEYGREGRAYHGQRHLLDVLERLEELWRAREFDDLKNATIAAFFHDYVHDGAPDDERRSAQEMRALLRNVIHAPALDEVERLILVTEAHDPADGDRAGAALSDADLYVLAGNPYEYFRYLADVREEYPGVDVITFSFARRDVLRGLLEGGVYRTETARSRWELAARRNLGMEIAWLDAVYPDAG